MKKALSLILSLIVILAVFPPARAARNRQADLFELQNQAGDNPVRIGQAVPVSEGIVVVPAAFLPEETQQLAVSDGVDSWPVKAAIPDSTGTLAVVFFDTGETTPRFRSWILMPYGESVSTVSCTVRSADTEDQGTECGVITAEEISRQGRRFLLLTLTEQTAPGSAVLTADGQLAAVVIAEWAEGTNRVLALPAEEIAGSLTQSSALLTQLRTWGDTPEGLDVNLNRNTATIDWTQMTLPEKAEGETLYLIVADTANNYSNFFRAETESRSVSLLLTPGRFYIAGIMASSSVPDSYPDAYVTFFVPQAKRLTDYRFEPVTTAIAESKDGKAPVPVTEVTEELLRSSRAFFYSRCTYQVVTTISDITLLVTLTDPNGVCYTYESGWVYSPDYMKDDTWYLLLKETGLTEYLDRYGYPAGVYTMAYYVNGDLADSFEFELK